MAGSRWDSSQLDRRASPRAEYRRTPPARLDLAGQACAVRDVNTNGLRVEPAPAGRAWYPGQAVSGVLYLRTSPPTPVGGRILRIGHGGLAIVPDGSGAWPIAATIETERHQLQRSHRDRRSEPRISRSSSGGEWCAMPVARSRSRSTPRGLAPDVLALLRRRFSGASSEPLP